jgi:hypothetical protein
LPKAESDETEYFADDWYEYASRSYPGDVQQFCKVILPRLWELMRADVEAMA